MADSCLDSKLLAYGGTSQQQRLTDALRTTYAQADERTAADLILFAKKYAAYLSYYDASNTAAGDWQAFMSMDAAVIIADVEDWRAKEFASFIKDVNERLQDTTDNDEARKMFTSLFSFVFTLATKLDNNLKNLPASIPFKTYLGISVASTLALPLNTLYRYFENFTTASLIDDAGSLANAPVDDLISVNDFSLAGVSDEWKVKPPFSVPVITLDSSADAVSNINLVITHSLFTGALQAFLNGVIKIVARASSYLDDVLRNYSSHAPHYALYLAFLRLFRFAQNKLNNFTAEHLDFYYKEVLQLSTNIAQPDVVHLLFELQKNVPDHILKKGTAFKAGKDANNNELFYTLTDDVVLHQSGVQSLHSLFLKKDAISVLYASPVANSADGNGAALQSADKSWNAFLNSDKIKPAIIGFAIASNLLYLNEGNRTVTLAFTCSDTSSSAGITPDAFNGKCCMQFTGKKKWFDPAESDPTIEVNCTVADANHFSLSVTIPGNAPAVVPYSAKIHGGTFTQPLPMLQLQLTDYTGYAAIKKLDITSIELTVEVDEVKNLSLQNDEGKIDNTKPFKPFGEFPENDASFIIGSKEIFQKPLTKLSFQTNWQPSRTPSGTVDADVLKVGTWQELNTAIDISSNTFSLTNLLSIPVSTADFSANEDYDITSIDGFIKLMLNTDDYSLTNYLSNVKSALSQTTITLTNTDPTKPVYQLAAPAVQAPPQPPELKSISASYKASRTISLAAAFSKRIDFFYHIEPFGYREMHGSLRNEKANEKLTVLPVFNMDNQDGNKQTGGELWIGLNNVVVPETVSILFQVAEGTSNPLLPATVVSWYYLSANNWLLFDNYSFRDQTNYLTRSGIVTLNIPKEAVMANTRADARLFWVKAVVNCNTDAVCRLITVTANAAKATFLQDVSKNIVFTKPLPANTISKPAVADAALKKTMQPYSSFDGRIAETSDRFYTRVSERLRHKHRAVTMWDYERLVLQNYPQIHKVKCLNHTGLVTNNAGNPKYSELLPGHVTIVAIPNLQNNTTSNVLRPYTSIGLLGEIQAFLQQLTSPFVVSRPNDAKLNRLHVLNPQFEEVRFAFSVSFMPDHDETVFASQLNTEIEQFLTPWAYSTGTDIEFGNRIEKSVVLNFIEEREYVHYVTCFTMSQIIRDEEGNVVKTLFNLDEAVPTTARSILVSYNDGTNRHSITSPANCDCNA